MVKQFASDDATVVIGTVIDPEMTDEIRVTVVATGLGQAVGIAERADEGRAPLAAARHRRAASRTTRTSTSRRSPRKRAVGDGMTGNDSSLEDLLDIPAFLRRQAD